ncbi:putative rRNA-processing protein UTP23 [Monocercomonoides exilis]|uniref:putative rRNA-processing protein UTP23 n=1 Tax=Monocercomonoides exilis TaxID=2049356 RepID=UPI003559FBF4|nr:putative rRNA-processing protein UTP23 [Monocercomonoides exilis]
MKVQRLKKAKKALRLFKTFFNLKSPYCILLDCEFLKSVLHYGVDVHDQMRKLFCEPCRLFVTPCVIREIKKNPESEVAPLLKLAKTCEMHYCHHEENCTERQCILSLIDVEDRKFCMAVQNHDDRRILREIPGVPLIHMNLNVIVVEPPSKRSTEFAENERSKQRANMMLSAERGIRIYKQTIGKDEEAELLTAAEAARQRKALSSKSLIRQPDSVQEEKLPFDVQHHRKVAKGPNPLSVKKKQQKERFQTPKQKKQQLEREEAKDSKPVSEVVSNTPQTRTAEANQKKKRTRKRKIRETDEEDIGSTATNISSSKTILDEDEDEDLDISIKTKKVKDN